MSAVQSNILHYIIQPTFFLGAAFLAGSNRLIQYFPGASKRGLVMAAGLASVTSCLYDYALYKEEHCYLRTLLGKVGAIAFATLCATHLSKGRAEIPFGAAARLGVIECFGAATIAAVASLLNTDEIPDADEIPEPRFLTSELKTFRAALKQAALLLGGNNVNRPIQIDVEGTQYAVWYNSQFDAINIQEWNCWRQGIPDEKLGINIDPNGRIQSIWINGSNTHQTKIPEKYQAHVRACFHKTLERSSTYRVAHVGISVRVIRRGLKEIPGYHLEQITKMVEQAVKQTPDPKMNVEFLRDDLTVDMGIDAGGLTRDYTDDLLQAVTQMGIFSIIEPSSLVLPRIGQPYDVEADPIPMLEKGEESLFRGIGQLIMYSYHSRSVGHWDSTFVLGRHFDEALFKAALCLKANEIDTPFDQLHLEVKMQIASALIQARVDAGETHDKCYLERVETLSKLLGGNLLTDPELTSAAEACYWSESLDEALCEGGNPDIAKIKDNKELFQQCLIKSIFNSEGAHGQLGSQIAAIHAIAQGMKSVCKPGQHNPNDNAQWDGTIGQLDYLVFSHKVQGSLNREDIADGIQLKLAVAGNAEIGKKVGWLKEWIRSEASNEELRNFLKFTTGVSGFPQGRKITINAQVNPYYPAPKAHTCSFEMELAPASCQTPCGTFHDRSEEGFIQCLREIALTDLSGYGQA